MPSNTRDPKQLLTSNPAEDSHKKQGKPNETNPNSNRNFSVKYTYLLSR